MQFIRLAPQSRSSMRCGVQTQDAAVALLGTVLEAIQNASLRAYAHESAGAIRVGWPGTKVVAVPGGSQFLGVSCSFSSWFALRAAALRLAVSQSYPVAHDWLDAWRKVLARGRKSPTRKPVVAHPRGSVVGSVWQPWAGCRQMHGVAQCSACAFSAA
jgi:hypothetical protein